LGIEHKNRYMQVHKGLSEISEPLRSQPFS